MAVLLLLSLSALVVSGDQNNEDTSPVSQQVESFTFTNDTGMPVDGLVVSFDAKKVKTVSATMFGKAITVDKTITLSKAVLAPCDSTKVTFERDGAFQILSWLWSANDTSA